MNTDEREKISELLTEYEDARIEMEEGESKMNFAASELEDYGIDDPFNYKLPEE